MSKPRIWLYRLQNFDKNLFLYMKGLILDEPDNDSLILMLGEMKLFLQELINYYNNNYEGKDVIYNVKISSETNVIYK